MRLSQRQYFYIAAIIGLGIYNGVRIYRVRHAAAPTMITTEIIRHDKGTSPIWAKFDTAANLRDAPIPALTPALQDLAESIESSNAVSVPPATSKEELIDLQGCRTWLLFYRQEVLHPSVNRPGWRDQTLQHVLSCMQNHRDDTK